MSDRLPDPVFPLGDPAAPYGQGAPIEDFALLQQALESLKKGLKSLSFNRHRREAWAEYLVKPYELFARLLERGPLELKLEVSTLVWGEHHVLEDDDAERNLVYPLWQEGVRLLVFQPGLELDELMRFCLLVAGIEGRDPSEDLLTRLWREELAHVEWVVMTDFSLTEGDDAQEVEVEVEKVLTYLHREMTSDKGESISFARVSLDDLSLKLENLSQIRRTKVTGPVASDEQARRILETLARDEKVLLEKICAILFQVMELPASARDLDDIAAALEQLLDGLILEGKFSIIEKVLERLDGFSYRGDLEVQNRELARTCHEKLSAMMLEGQRVRAVGTALNTGSTKDLSGVQHYLVRLGPTATVQLLDLLDLLTAPHHRRMVADVLAEVGQRGVQLFANRLATASSTLAKELLYIIDRIDPPNKLELFAGVLKHDNAVLRMEGLSAIGKSRDERCYRIVLDVFEQHDVPQMRAHAARILGTWPPERAREPLLGLARDEGFEQRPEGERRAVLGALARLEDETAREYLRTLLCEKANLLTKRKVDDKKLIVIGALATAPSLPTLQLLADVAKDAKLHSKEVCEAAQKATFTMRARLLGEEVPR